MPTRIAERMLRIAIPLLLVFPVVVGNANCAYDAALVVWNLLDGATIDYSEFPAGWNQVLEDAVGEATGCHMTFADPSQHGERQLVVPSFDLVEEHASSVRGHDSQPQSPPSDQDDEPEHRQLQANSPWEDWCQYLEHYCDFGCVTEVVCDLYNKSTQGSSQTTQNKYTQNKYTQTKSTQGNNQSNKNTQASGQNNKNNNNRGLAGGADDFVARSPYPDHDAMAADEFDVMLENNGDRHLTYIFDGTNAAEIVWLHMTYDGVEFPSFLKSGWVQVHLFTSPN